jgi:hypothetical protein
MTTISYGFIGYLPKKNGQADRKRSTTGDRYDDYVNLLSRELRGT